MEVQETVNRINKILRELHSIQKRPGMYLADYNNYEKFCAFMEGLLIGLTIDSDENGYLEGTAKYFDKMYGCGSSKPLSYLIAATCEEMSEEEKCHKYLQVVIDYFSADGFCK